MCGHALSAWPEFGHDTHQTHLRQPFPVYHPNYSPKKGSSGEAHVTVRRGWEGGGVEERASERGALRLATMCRIYGL